MAAHPSILDYFSSFWTSNNANVSMLDVVPEFSLNSFFEFLKNVQLGRFPLFCLLIHSSVSFSLILIPFGVFFKTNFYWSMVALQCCVSFRCAANWINYIHSIFLATPVTTWGDPSFPRCAACRIYLSSQTRDQTHIT